MSLHKSLGKLSVALLTVVLLVASGAWAQSKYQALHIFRDGRGGSDPEAGLIFDQAGNLYGTTLGGGYGAGVVFKLTPSTGGSWKEKVLYRFQGGDDGNTPAASVIFDGAGNLYGITQYGGTRNEGTVFKLSPNSHGSWSESVLYSFCFLTNCSDGQNPTSALIFDAAGNLYGTTQSGGAHSDGIVFKLKPNSDGSWSESVLHSFCSLTNCSDGAVPIRAGLIFDTAGNLYGTTFSGGVAGQCNGNGCGVVFELTPNSGVSWTESTLYSFCPVGVCPDGENPDSLIFGPTGNLYGMTLGGGVCDVGCGTVFELTPNRDGSWKEKVLHAFEGPDGAVPLGGVIFDAAGSLYGTTEMGSYSDHCDPGCGLVFKLTPNSKGRWSETVLHRFAGRPAANPTAGLVFDVAGNLYGTASGSGANFGTVFEITP
jgi:uncharacterized repeat protein (TIGR03803 family)